jgi:hypothetical protein
MCRYECSGTVTSNIVQLTIAAQGIRFLTSETLGSLQNDFTGWVGMSVRIGSAPLVVSNLGRMVAPGNTGVHQLQIFDATGPSVGSSAQVDTSQATVGMLLYGVLANPVTLNANSNYYIMSHETKNGDAFYNTATVTQTTNDAVLTGPVYSPDGGPYTPTASPGNPYGPVDFSYTVLVSVSVTPTTVSLFDGQTQQFTDTVISNGNTAVTWSINPSAGSIFSSGLYTAPASISATQPVLRAAHPTPTPRQPPP